VCPFEAKKSRNCCLISFDVIYVIFFVLPTVYLTYKVSIIFAILLYICTFMTFLKKYDLNPDTLVYEARKISGKVRAIYTIVFFAVGLSMSAFYFWLYLSVFQFKAPKSMILERHNLEWRTKVTIMNRELDKCESSMHALQLRNDDIYRSIFGLSAIPKEVVYAGFGGVERYAFLDNVGEDGALKNTYMRLDRLTKQAYVQSKSFDEVMLLSKRAGDMASCVPAILPINPQDGSYRISSSYGGRTDPVHGGWRFHSGVDFATKMGNPVFATGDGVVESVKFQFFGYGNMVIIDHGFGYKTKYAHLCAATVTEGMKVNRGTCIGGVGNTGKSTGPHLHYEVEYRNASVNPYNFYDLEVTAQEYSTMVQTVDEQTMEMLRPKFQPKTRRRN